MNRLATVLERPEPTLAVVIAEPLNGKDIEHIATIADVAELRADKLPSQDIAYLAEQAGRLAMLPLLATIRIKAEGGNWDGSEEERFSIFTGVLPFVDGIDVELDTHIARKLTDRAHNEDKVVIGSSHSFECTPSSEALETILAKILDLGADYAKIAASAKKREDYERLADFTVTHRNDSVIVVAMDAYGPLSRIALPGLGSHLTYASSGKVGVAPGQLGYLETSELLKNLYPEYAELSA